MNGNNIIALDAPFSENGYTIECGHDGLKLFYGMKFPFSDNIIGAMIWYKTLTDNYELLGLAGELDIVDRPENIKDTHLLIKKL